MRNIDLKPLLLVCFIFTFINCQREEEVLIEQQNLIIDNPIALDLQERTKVFRYAPDVSDVITSSAQGTEQPTISFEEKYGRVLYRNMGEASDSVQTTMFPLVDENNKVMSWLMGFYKPDGNIQYYVNWIDPDNDPNTIIDENTQVQYDFSDQIRYYKPLEGVSTNQSINNINLHPIEASAGGSSECYSWFQNVCVSTSTDSFDPNSQDGDLYCKLTYVGDECHPTANEIAPITSLDGGGGGGSEDPFGDDPGSGGGSCPFSYRRDIFGNCVPICPPGYTLDVRNNCIERPCDNLQRLLNTAVKNKMDELEGKTSDTLEAGYLQERNGSFTKLNVGSDGHILDINNARTNNTIGFTHNHLDNFRTGKFLIDGTPEEYKNVRMFSPKDLQTFLNIVMTNFNQGRNQDLVYGSMVSSKGNFILKFTGNPTEISNTFNPRSLKKEYQRLIKENGKVEGFLKFVQLATNNNGVSMYEVLNNGSIREKRLVNNRIINLDCQ